MGYVLMFTAAIAICSDFTGPDSFMSIGLIATFGVMMGWLWKINNSHYEEYRQKLEGKLKEEQS